MKFLVLATFLTLAAASTVYKGSIAVSDDGTILISSTQGNRMVIALPYGTSGQKFIDISLYGKTIPPKSYQIYNSVFDGKTQGEILTEIFGEYQGVLDEMQFERLLSKIMLAVNKGEISREVYELLELVFAQTTGMQVGNVIYPSWYMGQYKQLYPYQRLFGGRYYGNNFGRFYSMTPAMMMSSNNQNNYLANMLADQQMDDGITGFLTTMGNKPYYGNRPYTGRYAFWKQMVGKQTPYLYKNYADTTDMDMMMYYGVPQTMQMGQMYQQQIPQVQLMY